MLLDAEELLGGSEGDAVAATIIAALSSSTRETDLSGWYQHKAVAGTILTEIRTDDLSKTVNAMQSKVNTILLASFNLNQLNMIHLSFHLFPDDAQTLAPRNLTPDLTLYPDLSLQDRSRRLSRCIKRTFDVLFTSLALALLSPLLAAIAMAIKLSSDGPVLFKQERLGRYGIPFTFLKFRSMYSNNDSMIHEEYVKQFISGKADSQVGAAGKTGVFKLTGDPRVTRLGKFLRRSSLDEIPQLLNVFKGEMSLVGPRPPIPYEFAKYDVWHRRRLLEARPGITGLWQVSGRSRTKFDDMVRLDLRYAKAWSLALDLKILLRTPRAVVSGEGAY